MNIGSYHIPIELIYIFGIIFSVLTICSTAFGILKHRKPSDLATELVLRTRSWWFIAIGLGVLVFAHPIVGTILVAYVSFVALREMYSISGMREADRTALFAGYCAIPVQYYLAYHNHYHQFLYFIPLVMFMIIAFLLVLEGRTDKISRSMPLIPTLLMLTTYAISHMILLFHIEAPGFEVGSGGLIVFLIAITAFNDVFQFTWGKLFGKHKILPTVSPNKTWEGFIGGVLTTAVFAVLIRFLTPLNALQAGFTGLLLGIMGFFGDNMVSAIKRDLHIKDTDDLIPGHGGAMDRLDSIIITTPLFYHLLRYFLDIS